MKKNRIVSLLLVLAMLMAFLPNGVLATTAAETVEPSSALVNADGDVATATVKVRAQQGTSFLYVDNALTVRADTAETYGFTDGIATEDGISALDVLVAAHAKKYGDEFNATTATDYLTVSASGNPGNMFGNDATGLYSGFAVNHDYAQDEDGMGYMANTAPVKDGDVLDFFYYEDEYWMDVISAFSDVNGKIVDSLKVKKGEEVTLNVVGFMYMMGYTDHDFEPVYSEDGALSIYDLALTKTYADLEDGNAVKVKFDEPGVYELTAMGFDDDYSRVIMPYVEITVTEDVTVYGTIAVDGEIVTGKDGNLVAEVPLEVPAGSTVDAVLEALHDKCYDGGAAAGYSSYVGSWGLSIGTLWGDNSGSFGYYVNNASCWSAADEVPAGGQLVAFVYADQTYWSDSYSHFDKFTAEVETGAALELTLTNDTYAADYSVVPVVTPGASVTVDGAETGKVTDADGKVSLTFTKPGKYVVSATCSDPLIVPPVCVVTVTGEEISSLLTELAFGSASAATNKGNYTLTATVPSMNIYELQVPEANAALYAWATAATSGTTITAAWTNTSNAAKTATLTSGKTTGTALASAFRANDKGMTFTVTAVLGDVTEVHTINVVRVQPTLKSLSVAKADGTTIIITPAFANKTFEYSAATDAAEVVVTAAPTDASCTVTVNGDAAESVQLADGENVVTVTVTNEFGYSTDYTVKLSKVNPCNVTITPTPSDAVVFVTDSNGMPVFPNEDGTYTLLEGTSFTWTVTKPGYVAQSGTETAVSGKEVTVTLTESTAPALEGEAYWKNFRNSDVNMAITDVATPKSKDTTEVLWAKRFGTSWADNPSVQIIVEDGLITMVNKNLYKLDLHTGEILATGTMVQASSYGYTPPTYAEGMIFVPLGNGTVQAFNAKTLESLWVYSDPLKGQAQTPIMYSDGCIYTGFWTSDTKDANFVCLTVTDEDPTQTNEAKTASWTLPVTGGFYWAGPVVVEDAVIFGSGAHKVYARDKKTGAELDTLPIGDIGTVRSSMVYDEEGKRLFFTTTEGYVCSASYDKETHKMSDLKTNKVNASCTSTPVLYGGKLYFGAGEGFDKGAFTVCDANTLELLYTVDLLGKPQASVLLSTAYLEEDGELYFYTTYNYPPGGVTLLKVKPDATTADGVTLEELFDGGSYQQYCISSLICGPDGTLYYKNDSSNVIALHEHNYTKVNFDENCHWLECGCGDMKDIEGHEIVPMYDENGHWIECDCGYKTEVMPHDLGTTLHFDETGHWKECDCGYKAPVEEHELRTEHDDDGHWTTCDCGYESEHEDHDLRWTWDEEFHSRMCDCGYYVDFDNHNFHIAYDENGHWYECECGAASECEEHEFSDWEEDEDADGNPVFVRSCDCGYVETKENPRTGDTSNTVLWAMLLLTSAAALLIMRKRRSF